MLIVNWPGIPLSRLRMKGSNVMKISLKTLFIFCLFFPLQVMGKEYSEQSLKTLFTSQQERQNIESGRKGNNFTGNRDQLGPASVQINGIVKRSNGNNVVWINGKSTLDNSMVDGVKVYPGSIKSNNKIPVLIDSRKIYIKPGEAWSEDGGISDVGK